MSHGVWIDVEKAFAIGRGVAPALPCQFHLDEDKGSRRDFTLACPIAMLRLARSLASPRIFANRTEFSLSLHGTPLFTWPVSTRPSGQPVGLNVQIAPDVLRLRRFRISGTFASKKSALYPGRFGSNSSPLVTPLMWMQRGVYGVGKLRRALLVPISLHVALPSRILAVMWVGTNSPYAPSDWEAGVEIVSIAWIVPMTLMSPTLASLSTRLLPLCFASDVGLCRSVMYSKALSSMGLQTPRVAAFWHQWHVVTKMGPTGPVTSFEPWTHWIPPDLHGFYKWAMDALALLDEFFLKVVHSRQTAQLQAWSNWIREDLTSHPHQWLRPDFVPPLLSMPTFVGH